MAGKNDANTKAAKAKDAAEDAAAAKDAGAVAEPQAAPEHGMDAGATDVKEPDAHKPQAVTEASDKTRMAESVRSAVKDLGVFLDFVCAVLAVAVNNTGLHPLHKEKLLTADDLMAATIKGRRVIVVTKDGRKVTLQLNAPENGENHAS